MLKGPRLIFLCGATSATLNVTVFISFGSSASARIAYLMAGIDQSNTSDFHFFELNKKMEIFRVQATQLLSTSTSK
jgi:hypothetical protein